jgi:hypothetical protein
MNIHNRYRTIYFARVCPPPRMPYLPNHPFFQSGHSLIEHSYKADSDLSPAGWEYADRLKEFVVERRNKSLRARGLDPETRRLVVSLSLCPLSNSCLMYDWHLNYPDMDFHPSPSLPHRLALHPKRPAQCKQPSCWLYQCRRHRSH